MPLQLLSSPCIAGSNGTLSGTPAAVPSWLRQGETSGENTPLPTSPSGSAGISQAVDCASQTGNSSEVGGKPDSQTDLFLPASGLPPIPGHLVQAIKDRKFVDLSDLLPEALRETQFDRVSDRKEDSKAKRKYTISTPLEWMVAFTTFMAVTVHFNTQRAFELATYASIVLTLARDIKGAAWAKYDRLFRQAAAVNPQLCWHRREQDIWMMSVTEASTLGTARPPCQQGQPPAQRSTEICRKWNRGACPFNQCRYRHVCFACQEPGHITRDCPFISTSPKAPATGKPAKP